MSRRSTRSFAAVSIAGLAAASLAAGCAADNSLVGGSCASGYVQCGDLCVDIASDTNNCGACGTTCSDGVACLDGVCASELTDGSALDGAADGAAFDGAHLDGGPTDSMAGRDGAGDAQSDGGRTGDGSSVDASTDSAGNGAPDGSLDGGTGDAASDGAPDGGRGTTGDGAPDGGAGGASDGSLDATPGDGATDAALDSAAGNGAVDGSGEAASDATGAGSADATLDGGVDGATEGGAAADSAGEDGATDATLPGDAGGDATLEAGPFDAGPATDGSFDDGSASDVVENTDSDILPDGACAPGIYDTPGACGDCFTVCTGNTPLCSPTDGGFACVPLCSGSLTSCNGQCVDLTSDGLNCGSCGFVCPSQICVGSMCQFAPAGGIIFIGENFDQAIAGANSEAQSLSNAVFIPLGNPINVLNFTEYADPAALTHITDVITQSQQAHGRQVNVTPTNDPVFVMNDLGNYQVLLVPDQTSAQAGTLAGIGSSWATALSSFVRNSGIVVVLDGDTGAGEMPLFVSSTGLLTITSHTPVPAGSTFDVSSGTDVESIGLASHYKVTSSSVLVTTSDPNAVPVVTTTPDGGIASPFIIHKAF